MQENVGGVAGTPLSSATGHAGRGLLALAALVLIGDLLFWAAPLGISLVLFAWVVFAAVAALTGRLAAGPVLLLAVGSFPVVEYTQMLSVSFLIATLVGAVAWLVAAERASPLALATRIAVAFPIAAIRDIRHSLAHADAERLQRTATRATKAWAFPLAGAGLLLALLAEANPVLLRALSGLVSIEPNWLEWLPRGLFWLGLAGLIWPLLRQQDQRPAHVSLPTLVIPLPDGAILRALLLFNLVLAVQTGLDAAILLGGGTLPEGMTYAEYARRGAFPLLAATMLGGVFAVVAGNHTEESAWLKPLLFLWLAQNVMMTLAAGYRLTMYVEAYGLTYLRVHAGIWMGVVVVLLIMTGVQIWRLHSSRWLLLRSVALVASVLYVACFVNFADLIARQNLARGGEVDFRYLREDLPSTGHAPLAEHFCAAPHCPRELLQYEPMNDWREWGFRRWRVDRRMEEWTTVTEQQP